MSGDRATPDPSTRDSIVCGVCGTIMDVTRDVHGATGMAEAMAKRGHLHDSFQCPDIEADWHVQAKMIREVARRTPSKRIEQALLEEAAEILSSRCATKRVSRWGV